MYAEDRAQAMRNIPKAKKAKDGSITTPTSLNTRVHPGLLDSDCYIGAPNKIPLHTCMPEPII